MLSNSRPFTNKALSCGECSRLKIPMEKLIVISLKCDVTYLDDRRPVDGSEIIRPRDYGLMEKPLSKEKQMQSSRTGRWIPPCSFPTRTDWGRVWSGSSLFLWYGWMVWMDCTTRVR